MTPGIGVLCRTDADLIGGIGIYKNSNGNTSKYAMLGWQPLDIAGIKLGAFFGTVDGYNRGNGSFVPMAGLAATWGHINLIAWPAADAKSSAGIALSFTIPIGD
jgi:hypothetical protein